MLSTKNLITSYKDVPSEWIFEHYCKLDEKLEGQCISIRSVFSNTDTVPSMKIYLTESGGSYKFKDFSSGYSGDCWDLIRHLKKITLKEAVQEGISEYKKYLENNDRRLTSTNYTKSSYKVLDFKTRNWDVRDKEFWTQFNIGSKILKEYNVKAIDEYTLIKEGYPELKFKTGVYYGYFNKFGELIKIYQPYKKELKFFNVNKYIQGLDQTGKYNILCIMSSMKDIMAARSLNLKLDMIAPDSENTYLNESFLNQFRQRYKEVFILLDNDEAGIKAMKRYRDTYGFVPILLPMSKDLSDSIRDFGPKKVLENLVPKFERFSLNLSNDMAI